MVEIPSTDELLSSAIQGSSARTMLANIPKSKKVELLAQLHGFSEMPPTIDEFIEDDYYLGKIWGKGKLYPYWKEKLREICPDPIRMPNFILSLGGALGIGKSSISMILSAYVLKKLACLYDIFDTFHLTTTTAFTLRMFNLSKEKAQVVLIDPMFEQIKNSPFFIEYQRDHGGLLPGKISILPARRANDIISECVVLAVLSELNFFGREAADSILRTAISRMSSRLQYVQGIFGTIILDSSATTEKSVVEEFIKSGEYSERLKVIRASIWEVKPQAYFKTGSFQVYAGDSFVMPHIVDPNEDMSRLDPERLVTIPNELKSNFKIDICKALMDQAGISLDNVNDFFTEKQKVSDSFTLDNPIKEVYDFDFFDEEQIFDRIGDEVLSVLPKDRKLYIRIDLGLVTDLCGFSIGHINEIVKKKINSIDQFVPQINVPISFGISRLVGQETPIHKIISFILWLSTHRDIAEVSTDQYQSSSIRQACTEHGIPNKLLSVDRTDTPYIEYKNAIYRGQVKHVKCKRLETELLELQYTDNKVDHPMTGSKDLADSVCGLVYDILKDGIKSADVPDRVVVENINQTLGSILEANKKRAMMSRYGIRIRR